MGNVWAKSRSPGGLVWFPKLLLPAATEVIVVKWIKILKIEDQ